MAEPKLINSRIEGLDLGCNVLYCEPGVVLKNTTIKFFGKNNLIYLSKGSIQANLVCTNNSKIYIGSNNYFPTCYSGMVNPFIRAADGTTIIIGSDCPISTGVCIESGDGHDTFDMTTGEKLTKNKSIFIGDHVWLGRDIHILKGSVLNTGCTIGSGAVLSGKHVGTGEIWGGIPAKMIKNNVIYGHMNQSYLGSNTNYTLWNSPDAFAYNEKEEISTDVLEKFTLEDFKNLKLSNGRFIWK